MTNRKMDKTQAPDLDKKVFDILDRERTGIITKEAAIKELRRVMGSDNSGTSLSSDEYEWQLALDLDRGWREGVI